MPMSTCAPTHTRVYISGLSAPRFGKSQGTDDASANFGTSSPHSLPTYVLASTLSIHISVFRSIIGFMHNISSFSHTRETVESLLSFRSKTYHNIAEFSSHADSLPLTLFAFIDGNKFSRENAERFIKN